MTLCEREKCAKCVRAVAAELERLQHDYELLARECSNLTVEFQHAQEKLDEELREHKITKKRLERLQKRHIVQKKIIQQYQGAAITHLDLLRDAGTAVAPNYGERFQVDDET